MDTALEAVLEQLACPAHIVPAALRTPTTTTAAPAAAATADRARLPAPEQARLLRWLHLRFLRQPDNGQRVAGATLRNWCRLCGVVAPTTPPAPTPAAHTSTITTPAAAAAAAVSAPFSLPLASLTQLAKTVLCADRAHRRRAAAFGGARPDPSESLLRAVSNNRAAVFSADCQLFPFDMQWIVAAAEAAPAQFTPSLDALQAEVEVAELKCLELRSRDPAPGADYDAELDAALSRNLRASSRAREVSDAYAGLLGRFSKLYAARLRPAVVAADVAPVGDDARVGPLARRAVPRLAAVQRTLDHLRRARRSSEGLALLLRKQAEGGGATMAASPTPAPDSCHEQRKVSP